MKMKRTIRAALLAVLLLTAAACSNNDGNGGKPSASGGSAQQQGDSATELSVFVRQSSGVSGYEDNQLTRKVEQLLNIKLRFEVGPEEGTFDRQQVLFASGDYPAAFLAGQFNHNDQVNLGKNKLIIPLNDLIEQHAPNIKKAFEEKPYFKAGVTAPDGNIYSLPALEECYHCEFYNKLWINKKWLDKLGLPLPTTTEEMERTLLAFRNGDPNGNGRADEVALSGGGAKEQHLAPIGFFMNAFIYDNEFDYLTVNGGQVGFAADKPEWREGLRYLNRLYEQQLIDPNSFTQDHEGLFRLGEQEGEPVLGAFAAHVSASAVDLGGDRWTDYVAVPPLTGPAGVRTAAYRGGEVFDGTFAITNKATAEQQVAAIRLADYFFGKEGTLDMFFGVKGQGWNEPQEGAKGIDGNPALFEGKETEDELVDYSWAGMFYYMPADMFNGWASSQDVASPEGYETFLYRTNKLYDGTQPKEIYPATVWLEQEDAQQLAQIQVDLVSYVKQKQIRFITGLDDIETDWDAYVKEFGKYKLAKYLELKQKALDAAQI